MAEDTLTDFIVGLGTTRVFDEDALEELGRWRTAVPEADTNLAQAKTELGELEGNQSLRLQDRQAAVAAAQANLAVARDLVEELESESDQLLEFQLRQAAAVVAQANLDQARKDLEEESAGPDPLVLRKLEAAVEAIQAELAQAEFDLAEEMSGPDTVQLALRQKELARSREVFTELVNGPDLFEVAVKEAAVASAQAEVDDALEELAGATIRAPFDGVIRLINVDIDDMVSDESRVIEIVEPSAIQVNGFVDAADIQFVRKGSVAKVTIDALPGQVLEVTVSSVAAEPRTERGVVRYPITISFEPPEGVEVPVGLSGVSSEVLYEEKGVLSVPQGALHRTSKQTMVTVMNDGIVEERAVIPGDVDGSWVAVLEGLEEGDQVVVGTAQVASTSAGLR